ncbi:MAG TPA: hypothetical protein DIT25_04285 [Candidatus Moranbacteria bacterium]|nr:hypothetical protein [Candidatus Moranbacteria bacterium]
MTRKSKRISIISIYLLILISLIGIIFYWNWPEPSCFDGKLNQNEQGIDCGGICAERCEIAAKEDLAVLQTGFVSSGSADNFDIYALINNPNQVLASSGFGYKFIIKDFSDEVIGDYSGTSFILPGEKKYLLANNMSFSGSPAKVELSIINPEWVEVNELYEKPQLKVVNRNYREITSGAGFSEASGLVKNESSLAFAKIGIVIIIKDEYDKEVGFNSTEMRTVQAGENRAFSVQWPNRFPGNVSNMEIQPEVNVFSSEAFVKKYFKTGKFQQY